ncbi:MAG: sigma-E factor negative regulatory protein [Halieaceae bacterium]|jgi:sigma-E factor negative regulatory protein RseA|nr:sigma-E factor negative regulatory protein [Halieaceae bacterium]
MNDQLRQSLSALMDGEAGPAELDEILDGIDEPQLRETWRRYHLASHQTQGAVETVQTLDISARVMAVLANEPAHAPNNTGLESASDHLETAPEIQPVGRWTRFLQPLVSVAVAASVAAVVVLGAQYTGFGGQNEVAAPAVTEVAESTSPVVLLGGAANLAGYAPPSRVAPATGTVSTADYNALAQERLQRYILSHAEEASLNTPQGMMPYARVATFKSEE